MYFMYMVHAANKSYDGGRLLECGWLLEGNMICELDDACIKKLKKSVFVNFV